MRLSELQIGKKGIITGFDKEEFTIKLMEMGCIPGELVKMEQRAPLGDPLSVYVAGYNLSLRRKEAYNIFIEEI